MKQNLTLPKCSMCGDRLTNQLYECAECARTIGGTGLHPIWMSNCFNCYKEHLAAEHQYLGKVTKLN